MGGILGFPLQLTDPGNYWDLRIVGNDIALDVGRQPLKLADRASIAQDIAHMIRERGYLTAMIAERDPRKRRYQMVLITIAAWVLFGQKLDLPALIGMALIVAGVVVMNVFSKAVGH